MIQYAKTKQTAICIRKKSMKFFDFSNAEYSNRNGSYGGAAGEKDGILINGEPWIAKYPKPVFWK